MAISKGTQLAAGGGNIPRGYAAGSMAKYTPEQLDLFKSLFSQVGPQSQLAMQARGEDAGFEPYEEGARRNFQEYTGQLASRFSGQGLGARGGSAFQNMATQGASDFALQLAQQRQNLQRQAMQDLMSHSQMLLGQQPYDTFLNEESEKKSPKWHSLIKAGLPIAGSAAGGYFGGPGGAALGGKLGNLAASGLTGAWKNVEY